MKIAVWHNLPSGGGKRALYDHVVGLLKLGHEVEVWAPPTIDTSYLPLSEIVPEHIVDLTWSFPRRLTDRLLLTWEMDAALQAMDDHCRECARQMEDRGFDILFANSCQFLRTTSIGRLSKLPSVLYLQEPCRYLYEALPKPIWIADMPPAGTPSGLGNVKARLHEIRRLQNLRIQMRAEIENAAAFDTVLCNSYFSRESILRAYNVEPEVCYLGIDETLFSRTKDRRENIVVGLGAFIPEKNLPLCIKAVGAMPGLKPKLVWVGNVGDPGFVAEMEALARTLGVELECLRRVTDGTLLDTMSVAYAMVYAPRLEPFGLAPLEASACQLPVVAVPEGGVKETVVDGRNGLVCEPTPASMASALVRLRDEAGLVERLGTQGRAFVLERWTRDLAAERLSTKLSDCLAQARR